MPSATEITRDALPAAMEALKVFRSTIYEVAPRIRALPHVHDLLQEVAVDLRDDGGLRAGSGWGNLRWRIETILLMADEGEIQAAGDLTADQVSRLIQAARESVLRLRAYLPPAYPAPVVLAEG